MPGQKITLVLQHPIVRSRVMVETQTESSDRSRVLVETRTRVLCECERGHVVRLGALTLTARAPRAHPLS